MTFRSKKRLGKIFVFRHGMHQLQSCEEKAFHISVKGSSFQPFVFVSDVLRWVLCLHTAILSAVGSYGTLSLT
jgi:hypothetical protein